MILTVKTTKMNQVIKHIDFNVLFFFQQLHVQAQIENNSIT